jgi:hypothetical protein
MNYSLSRPTTAPRLSKRFDDRQDRTNIDKAKSRSTLAKADATEQSRAVMARWENLGV